MIKMINLTISKFFFSGYLGRISFLDGQNWGHLHLSWVPCNIKFQNYSTIIIGLKNMINNKHTHILF